MSSPALLSDLLRDVSRSFYLTLRVLPRAIRPQISLAYLLARATDTIADTALVPVEQRLEALSRLRARIQGESETPLDFAAFLDAGTDTTTASAAEHVLLRRIEDALQLLRSLDPADLLHVRAVLDTITSGQELDLRRFGHLAPGEVASLSSKAEFDDYTYRVAGCVGEFWTRMCRAHLFPGAGLDEARLLAEGIRFGRGLQMVNILRDLPRDLRIGRCYLPCEALAAHGLKPAHLLDPAFEPRLRPLYHEFLAEAQSHLAAGWSYTNSLPRRCVRVRLACAWPVLIGVRTVQHLRRGNVLDASHRLKVSRVEVRRVLWKTLATCWWPRRWNALFAWAARGTGGSSLCAK